MRAVALLALVGCSFEHGQSITRDGGPPDDAVDASMTPDASLCTEASVECADPTVLRTCTGPGVPVSDRACSWGCVSAGTPHCGQLVPTTGSVPMDKTTSFTGLTDVDMVNGIIVNTSTGQIGNLNNPDAIHDNNVGIDNGVDYQEYGTAPGVTVFRFRKLIISGNITIVGDRAVVFVADQEITVGGVVDARGPCTKTGQTVGIAGPGGFAGGAQKGAGLGTGGGGGGGTDNTKGGGGAGYGSTGGLGGNTGGAGGLPYNSTINTLVGGSGGGGGGGGNGNTQPGGGGGGAIQMISNKSITISAGGINAGGCGGFSTTGPDSGAGGGAGGLILLEAPAITLAGALAVNGGGGGSGPGLVLQGENGKLSRAAAAGAIGDGIGGAGGAGATLIGGPGTMVTKSGGGGGAVGRIRIETRDGTHFTQEASAVMSPNLTDTGTTASHVSATVQ
jgi:hypothetical protein